MDTPVIECPVSGRQRISLNRASLRRKRSMKATAKTAVAAAASHTDTKAKPRVQKARSTVLQECVKTYFASLNSISRSIVLESEALQKLFGPEWENMNAKQQEELLNKHFVPTKVVEHYSIADRSGSMSPFSDTEPEIDVTPRSNRSSAKKGSIVTSDEEACFTPKMKNGCDTTQGPAAVSRWKEKEPPFRANMPNSSITALIGDDEEGVDTMIDRMDPVRRSFRVSARQLAESRNRSMSMRVSRTRQQHHANRSQASIRRQTETNAVQVSPNHGITSQETSRGLQPTQQYPVQGNPRQAPQIQPMQGTVASCPVPLSRTSSACSSVSSSVGVSGIGGRTQKYSLQRHRHYSSQAVMFPSEHNNSFGDPQLTRYSRSEGASRLHHNSALSLSNGRTVRFEDDDHATLSQSCEATNRKFVPLNQRWQENMGYSPRRSRSQSPGKILGELSQRSRGRSQSPGTYLDSHLPSDTDYYADSDIASLRSITPESILESDTTAPVRLGEKKYVVGIQRSCSALKNRGGSSITTTTSSFANPRRRSLSKKTHHRVTDTISEVDNNSFRATEFYTQSQQDCRVMTPLDATDRLAVPAASMVDIWHSKTESDVGYISAGADELDSDVKSPAGLRSNRESGYLSCCDSIPSEQNTTTRMGGH